MDISELQRIYAGHPNTKGLAALLEDSSVRTIFLGGLHASAAALFVDRKSTRLNSSHCG